MAGKKSKAGRSARSVRQAVEALASELDLDQVVVVGWRAKDDRYLMVAHGRNRLEQHGADEFARRLIVGAGIPAGKLDNEKTKNSRAKEG